MRILAITKSKLVSMAIERSFKHFSEDIIFMDYDIEGIVEYHREKNVDLVIVQEMGPSKQTLGLLEAMAPALKSTEYPSVILIMSENSYGAKDLDAYKKYFMSGDLIAVKPSALEEMFDKYVEKNIWGKIPFGNADKLTKRDFPILIVDDSLLIRNMMTQNFRDMGYWIFEAEDGFQALEMFKKRNFRIIITDIMMPRMDGIELCQKIKEINQYTEIIIMSSLGEQESIDTAYLVGASDYFMKPLQFDDLERRISAFIQRFIEQAKYKVLVVDADATMRQRIYDEFKQYNVDVITAINGVEGLSYALIDHPDMIVADVDLPLLSGYEMLAAIKRFSKLERTSRILMSSNNKLSNVKRNISDQQIQFLSKPIDVAQLVSQMELLMLSRRVQAKSEDDLFISSIQALIKALEARDEYTRGHSDRVTDYAVRIGHKMDLSGNQIKVLALAASLHDIGKIGVKDSVLLKPDKLTDDEYDQIKDHPTLGANIIKSINALQWISNIIQSHHERIDGRGYPNKLSGLAIPLEARIIAVADTYDAMTTVRPYRKNTHTKAQALEELMRVAGTQLCPICVDAFIAMIENEPV